jgi:hypothetical protein
MYGGVLTGVICTGAAASVVRNGNAFLGLSFDARVLGMLRVLLPSWQIHLLRRSGSRMERQLPRGTEGAISLEGTVASVVGGLLLPMYAYGVVGLIGGLDGVAVATFAAFVATMVESLIGATMQDKEGMGWMTNEVVNFFNTVIKATLAIVLGSVILRI